MLVFYYYVMNCHQLSSLKIIAINQLSNYRLQVWHGMGEFCASIISRFEIKVLTKLLPSGSSGKKYTSKLILVRIQFLATLGLRYLFPSLQYARRLSQF